MLTNTTERRFLPDWIMSKLVFPVIALLVCSFAAAGPATPTPLDQYYAHATAAEWQQALPIIQELVEKDPSIPSRWFQYGSCLEELQQHAEAILAFKRAYELDSTDFGAQYRIFRNYALAGDVAGFVGFARLEVVKTPQIIERINQREEFKAMVSSAAYREFLGQLSQQAQHGE